MYEVCGSTKTLKVLSLLRDELKGEHAQLLQSTSVAQEKAVAQRELLERTIERLRGELSKAKTEEETMRKDLECSKDEVYSTVLLFARWAVLCQEVTQSLLSLLSFATIYILLSPSWRMREEAWRANLVRPR